ncbi:hypothetical protein [Streptomyces sp. NPDC056169]|uniref:hypothetical protein n=1 Tax=Streptomyces sp. NPDC056169 TaxID=3345734 RepID=UPI0035D564C6
MSIDWGDAPTWVAGAFAAAAAYYTRGMLKSQRQQIDEQRQFIAEQSANLALERQALSAQAQDRRVAHARQISADWYGNMLRVLNASSAPITAVTAMFGELPSPKAHEVVPSGLGNHELLRGDFETPVQIVGAGRTYAFAPPEGEFTGALCVLFSDEDGERWRLSAEGALESVPQEEEGTPSA